MHLLEFELKLGGDHNNEGIRSHDTIFPLHPPTRQA
jgi:hypothetical protein